MIDAHCPPGFRLALQCVGCRTEKEARAIVFRVCGRMDVVLVRGVYRMPAKQWHEWKFEEDNGWMAFVPR